MKKIALMIISVMIIIISINSTAWAISESDLQNLPYTSITEIISQYFDIEAEYEIITVSSGSDIIYEVKVEIGGKTYIVMIVNGVTHMVSN